MPNKILLVTAAYFPEVSPRSFRATELSKALAAQGHEVTVLIFENDAIKNNSSFEGIRFLYLNPRKWKPLSVKGSGIIKLWFRFWTRILLWLLEYPNIELVWLIKNKLQEQTEQYDALISIAVPYPVHWGVACYNNKNNKLYKRWIADCGDPYMGQQNDTFTPPFYFKYIEKWFCNKTNFITVPTSQAIPGYYPEFHSKIKVIPQGFNFDEVKLASKEEQYKKTVFGYGGVFMPGKRDPKEMILYLESLTDKSFEFHIYTTTPQFVLPYLKQEGSKIKLFPPIDRLDLLFEFSKMAFVVNFENAGNIQTPSKLIDYALIHKPILSVPSGILYTERIDEFLSGNFSGALSIDNIEDYNIKNVANAFIKLVAF